MKNVVVEWTLELARESGGELLITDIAGVEIAVSGDNGTNWAVLPNLIPPATLTTTLTDVDIGSYLVRGVVVDTNGQRSTPTVRPFVVPDESAPRPLSSMTVTLN